MFDEIILQRTTLFTIHTYCINYEVVLGIDEEFPLFEEFNAVQGYYSLVGRE